MWSNLIIIFYILIYKDFIASTRNFITAWNIYLCFRFIARLEEVIHEWKLDGTSRHSTSHGVSATFFIISKLYKASKFHIPLFQNNDSNMYFNRFNNSSTMINKALFDYLILIFNQLFYFFSRLFQLLQNHKSPILILYLEKRLKMYGF